MAYTLRTLPPEEWPTWRAIRLRALADTPDAFGSTLAAEQAYQESDWREWLEEPAVVALDQSGAPVACGAVFERAPGRAAVVSMWVDPAHRGRGLSRRVLDVLVGWARARGLAVEIGVNRANPAARAAYASYGFVPTGESYPLREGSGQRCDALVLPGPEAVRPG
jgi:GNAT superfamily N-acetyltransferase